METERLSLRLSIKSFKDALCNEFKQNGNINTITHKLVSYIDEILMRLFQKHHLDLDGHFCLLALGSYGRRELQLHSDIDLLILHDETLSKADFANAQLFIQECWDIGLLLSHQITTVNVCAELAHHDITVISSILDAHLICGRGSLLEELLYQTHPLHMWTSYDFFYAKCQEQHTRYEKYGETAYNLEPNVKHGPGGLRDLQVLLSVGKRHFGIKKLADGIGTGFITEKEYEELLHCQHFLWRVRFALHMIAEKNEERLLFDHQIKLAELFGYEDNQTSLGIEQFMKAYFMTIKRTRELNEILLQWFAEAIVHREKQKLIALDGIFQIANQDIEVKQTDAFTMHPAALLKLFLWMAKRPEIKGVRANTIRLIRQNLFLMNQRFRSSKVITELFMNILKEAHDPYEILQCMSRYGVLGHYLDCFAAVTGQMQYDLFHVYTVDQHTLFVIRNLARFLNESYQDQFPLCCQLMPQIPKREILYLAALFHDIAKGRGGDHSELGAIEVLQFGKRHRLSKEELNLLVWLVKNHLLMSHTAQRQDIYDPKTIQKFCSLLPETAYLDYLYLLTVADICGTNPSLWNAWKDSLLKELYFAANRSLQQERALLDETSLITLRRQQAFDILVHEGIDPKAIDNLWKHFNHKYFLHEPSEIIARHTKAILACKAFPLVMIMPHHTEGGTEVLIYMPHRDERFTITTTVLSNVHATIQEATILTSNNHFDLDTYIILDENNQAFFDEARTSLIQQLLIKHLTKPDLPSVIQRRLSRTQAHFKVTPKIVFTTEPSDSHTCLFLVTSDRSGLLANVSRIFLSEKINLHNAKISTAGERVEDTFYISNEKGTQLTPDEEMRLRQKLIEFFPNPTYSVHSCKFPQLN